MVAGGASPLNRSGRGAVEVDVATIDVQQLTGGVARPVGEQEGCRNVIPSVAERGDIRTNTDNQTFSAVVSGRLMFATSAPGRPAARASAQSCHDAAGLDGKPCGAAL